MISDVAGAEAFRLADLLRLSDLLCLADLLRLASLLRLFVVRYFVVFEAPLMHINVVDARDCLMCRFCL